MMDFFRNHKKYTIITLSVLALFMMIFTGIRGTNSANRAGFVLAGFQGFFTGIGDWFADRIDFFTNMNNLHAENAELRQQLALLEVEVARLLYVETENQHLAAMMDIPRLYSELFPLMGANIIAQNPTNWSQEIIINRGANYDIAVNMAVLAPGGLAGRISRVGGNFSIVTPLIEDVSAVSAATRRTGDIGMVRGDINLSSQGLLRMERISLESDILVGDEIITSQISSIYPPGIKIGVVLSIGVNPAGERYAIIQPSVDFSELTALHIITQLFDFEMME